MSNDVEKLIDIEAKIDGLITDIGGQSSALDSIDTKVTKIPSIYTELLDQGLSIDNIDTTLGSIQTEQEAQGIVFDAIAIEQTAQGSTLDNIETEQTNQCLIFDNIETEQTDQGLTLDDIETEQTNQGLSLDNIETEQELQGTTLDNIKTAQTDGNQISKIQDSNGSPLVADTTTGAISTISYTHKEIHDGTHYHYRCYEALLKQGVRDFLIITPNSDKLAHMTIGITNSAGVVEIDLREAATYSATGVLANSRNRNRTFPDNNTTLIYDSPTITGIGNSLQCSSLGAGKNKPGGESRDSEEIVLDSDTVYLLRITELNVEATRIDWTFDWYEHTNA